MTNLSCFIGNASRRSLGALGLLAALGLLPACPADKGASDTDITTSAATSGSGGVVTTGDVVTGGTDTSTTVASTTVTSTGDPDPTTVSSSSGGSDTTDGGLPDGVEVLASCELDEPCEWTYIDSCQIPCDDPAMQCMWPLLRDGATLRMRWAAPNQDDAWKQWVALGDAERTVLTTWQEGPQDAPVLRCTLSPPAFFTDCIDHPDQESCFIPGNWIDNCVPEPAPACPAP